MKGFGLFSILSAVLLLFTTFTSAWPWPESFVERVDGLLLRRQEKSASTNSATSTLTGASSTAASSTATASASASGSASVSGSSASSGTVKSGKSSSTSTHATKTTPIDPRLPPGGVQMITPAPIDGAQYYKIGDYVTFQWNYTSLSITPSHIDVLASCALNSATYTIAANMTVDPTGAVTWDTGEMDQTATNPFPVASYTLIIHDSQQDVTDVPSAGYLGAYEQYVFGMYTGQPYTPLNEFRCATCSGALSIHERQALGVLMVTGVVTFLSFTWFANGFGVFS